MIQKMPECKFGYDDCITDRSRCLYCHNGMDYKEPKRRYSLAKKRNKRYPDKRKGSGFEYANHERNQAVLKSDLTLNSGATSREKGDENLVIGTLRLMEELKTQEPTRARGCKSFSVKREWLNKLHREALERDFHGWYLKFAFNEDEAAATKASVHEDNPAGNVFVILEQDILMSMVQKMAEAVQKSEELDKLKDLYQKKIRAAEAENVSLKAEIEEIRAENKLFKDSLKEKKLEEFKRLNDLL